MSKLNKEMNHLTPKAQKLYEEAKLAFQEYEKRLGLGYA